MATFEHSTHSILRHGNRDLLSLLAGLAAHHGKPYCFPAYNTIQRLYGTFYGRPISNRTLARHLRHLEALGYIVRQRRHTRDKGGFLILKSTLYRLTTQALAVLRRSARKIAQALDSLAVTLVAKHLRPSLSHPPPEVERAPEGAARAPFVHPPPVDKPADKATATAAIEEMRRRLAGNPPRRRR